MISDADALIYLQPRSALVRMAGQETHYTLDARDALFDATAQRDCAIVVSEQWVRRTVTIQTAPARGGVGFDSRSFTWGGVPYQATCALTLAAMDWLEPFLSHPKTRVIAPEADWVLSDAEAGHYRWLSAGTTLLADWQQGVVMRLGVFLAPSDHQVQAWMFRERLQGKPAEIRDLSGRLPGCTPC